MTYYGTACSDGVGIGIGALIIEQNLDFSKAQRLSTEEEKKKFENALVKFTEEAKASGQGSAGKTQADILSSQAAMASDPFLADEIGERIASGKTAAEAVSEACEMFSGMFAAAEDELTRQRTADINDIKTGLLRVILNVKPLELAGLAPGTVIVAKEVTASMMSKLRRENIAGIAAELGGYTSHSAILARAMGIPAVFGADGITGKINGGDTLVIDGGAGLIISKPSSDELGRYESKREKQLKEREELLTFAGRKTVTADKEQLNVYANIGRPEDAALAMEHGGEGIGLFRTEFLFMDRASPPGEQEQYEAYSRAAKAAAGKEVIIRTLDVGGDKAVPYFQMEKEDNPFLGHRAIRYCLDREDVFRVQLKAILRAAAEYNIKIMLPLVTTVKEVAAAKDAVERAKAELKNENKSFGERVPIGVMIETPAAAVIADILADQVDFFSIGTNDLTQYTMAVDRGNKRVSSLYSAFDPAVLRLISSVIAAGKEKNIPVGMCGEAAADPMMIPLLIAFGLSEFSVNPASILKTRKIISEWKRADADLLAREIMAKKTADEVKEALCARTEK